MLQVSLPGPLTPAGFRTRLGPALLQMGAWWSLAVSPEWLLGLPLNLEMLGASIGTRSIALVR